MGKSIAIDNWFQISDFSILEKVLNPNNLHHFKVALKPLLPLAYSIKDSFLEKPPLDILALNTPSSVSYFESSQTPRINPELNFPLQVDCKELFQAERKIILPPIKSLYRLPSVFPTVNYFKGSFFTNCFLCRLESPNLTCNYCKRAYHSYCLSNNQRCFVCTKNCMVTLT